MGLPDPAQAQFRIGPHAGVNLEGPELVLGGNVRIPLNIQLGQTSIVANPGLEFYPLIGGDEGGLEDEDLDIDQSLIVINLDALYPLGFINELEPYLGAGLYIARNRISIDGTGFSDSETDAGINLIGGLVFAPRGALQPFAQATLGIGGGNASALILKGGVYLSFGGN